MAVAPTQGRPGRHMSSFFVGAPDGRGRVPGVGMTQVKLFRPRPTICKHLWAPRVAASGRTEVDGDNGDTHSYNLTPR